MGFQNVEAALHFRVYQWGTQGVAQWELDPKKEDAGQGNHRKPAKNCRAFGKQKGTSWVDLNGLHSQRPSGGPGLVITVGVPMVFQHPRWRMLQPLRVSAGCSFPAFPPRNVSVYRQGQVHFGVDQRKDANVVTLLWVLAVVLWIPSKVDNCGHNWPS